MKAYLSMPFIRDRLTWNYRHAAVVSIAERFLAWKVSKPTGQKIHQLIRTVQ